MSARPILFDCEDPTWAADLEAAKDLDRYAVRRHGQCDRDHHLCAEQRSQQQRGYVTAFIFRNIHGWCVRDTMNDGLGNMSGNFGTYDAAVEWARNWHAADPRRRLVFDASESNFALHASQGKRPTLHSHGKWSSHRTGGTDV